MSDMTPPGPPPGPPPAEQPEQPPAQPPMGWLRLVLQGSVLTSSLIPPTVTINGWRVAVQYGENVIPVHAGPNRIDVWCKWLKKFGEATLETTVPEGDQVTAYYAAPLQQFSRGAIGYEKQKRPGMVGFAVALALIAVVFVVIILITVTI